jgi:signal transduction histidine kinase
MPERQNQPPTINTRLLGLSGVLLALLCWSGLIVLRVWLLQMPFTLWGTLLELGLVFVGAIIFWQWIIATLERQAAEVRRRTQQLEALHTASMALTTQHDLTEVLQLVVDLSRNLLNAKYGALGILDESGTAIDQLITSGMSPHARGQMDRFPQGLGLLGIPLHEQQAVRVAKIAGDPRAHGFPPNHPAMHTYLGVPILSRGRMFGNLYLADKLPAADVHATGKQVGGALAFTQKDQELLEMFANQAAIAIDNAQLYRQNQQIAVLHERERFGMDLHDGVIQSIYAIGLQLDDARHRVPTDPESARQGIDQAIEGLNRVIRDIRSYIHDLRTHQFEQRDFAQGLEELVRDLQTYSILTVKLEIDPQATARIHPRLAKELLHITREALTNVRKHAHATHVTLRVARTDHGVSLTVVDNGVGIGPQTGQAAATASAVTASAATSVGGQGLRNMQERAARIHGTLAISPIATGGTQVEVTLPSEPLL